MMSQRTTIQGEVIGFNEILHGKKAIHCWTNAIQAAMVPQPLDLSAYLGLEVSVSGTLQEDLWLAWLEGVESEETPIQITGKVVGLNQIYSGGREITCYRHGMVEAFHMPLNLMDYMDETMTVAGILRGTTLYRASIVSVPERETGMDANKEATSLNDLLRIRAANREQIEAINGNLGTALGYKWTNGQRTNHPCIMIFVPQKLNPALVPPSEREPDVLEGPDGMWCLTDVVTGGKKESLADIDPLPPLSQENQDVIDELRSGNIGLIGGIQLAFYEGGIQQPSNAFVGTAGIAVRHRETKKVGFLTNQHVADEPGRTIYHPRHLNARLGFTKRVRTRVTDAAWYQGVIDESFSSVRCDCAFVQVSDALQSLVKPGLHVIGNTGSVLPINPDTMDIIGQKVISIGRTRGVQRGTIVAYAYEFQDDFFSRYTDLLIIGEEGKVFSWKGDSGKVIVTDDAELRPVALLWGGWQERLRKGREQEMWSYAIDLGKILDLLNLDVLV